METLSSHLTVLFRKKRVEHGGGCYFSRPDVTLFLLSHSREFY